MILVAQFWFYLARLIANALGALSERKHLWHAIWCRRRWCRRRAQIALHQRYLQRLTYWQAWRKMEEEAGVMLADAAARMALDPFLARPVTLRREPGFRPVIFCRVECRRVVPLLIRWEGPKTELPPLAWPPQKKGD